MRCRKRWILRIACAVISTFLLGAGQSHAATRNVSFTRPQFFDTAHGVLWDVKVADFNNDSRADLATAEALQAGDGGVSVLLNSTRRGSPVARFNSPFRLTSGPVTTAVAVGDLNNDGSTDIVSGNTLVGAVGGLTVMINRTAQGASIPRFGPTLKFDAGVGPTQVGLVDLNNDGKLDVVVGNSDAEHRGTSVLMNTTLEGAPVPTFTPPFFFDGGSGPEGLAIADINGDGREDIAMGEAYSSSDAIYVNTTLKGSMVPQLVQTRLPVPTANSVGLTDFNSDGKPDLVTNMSLGNLTPGLVASVNYTPRGSNKAKFQQVGSGATVQRTGQVPEYLAIADFDGDSRPDIATANEVSFRNSPGGVSVLINTTAKGARSIAFAPQQEFAAGWLCNAVAAADFNNDGRSDLVVGQAGSLTGVEGVAVLINTTARAANA